MGRGGRGRYHIDSVTLQFTSGESDAVALGVQLGTDLHEVTVSRDAVLHRGGLGQVGVFSLHHSLLALIGRFDKHARGRCLHRIVHFLVQLRFGFLPF